MPLVTAGDPAPVTITKYLLPNEKRVITVRKHLAILVRPIAFLILGLVIAGALTGFVGVRHGQVLLAAWLLFLVVLGYFIYQAVQWWESYFVVTNQRCLQTSGLITRRVNMLPLVKVTDVILERNLRARLLGYGKLTLESAGTFQALGNIDFLPYPEQLYLEISMLIFPYKEGERADD